MAAHTAGPWEVKRSQLRNTLCRVVANGEVVASIPRPYSGVEKYDANARLIESAPEMLWLIKRFSDEHQTGALRELAGALVAKIEGR